MEHHSSTRVDETQRAAGPAPAFTEAEAWASAREGWRPLFGGFRDYGFSIEWHDFTADLDLDMSRSFHEGSVEICLNIAGSGEVEAGGRSLELTPLTAAFYGQNQSRLKGVRHRGGRHQFVTVEFTLEFVARHLLSDLPGIHPCLKSLFRPRPRACVSEASRMTSQQREWIRALQFPPSNSSARRVWSQAKAMEVATTLLYPAQPQDELFCERMQRLNQERVQRVIAILKESLAKAPTLEEIGRRVGCSHFHLSRIFSEQMGCAIFQHLRTLRLERAAELIRRGEMKMTDVALEVGYSSPSHFTTAFREAFGCCPGLYPLRARASHARRETPRG